MYDWLEKEIAAIKTPRFHLVDGAADGKLREAVLRSELPLPESYRKFVLKFGNAKLYRSLRNDNYQIGVFAGPRKVIQKDGTFNYHLGFHDGAMVYVKPGSNLSALAIFESESGSEEEMTGSFDEWLSRSCAQARLSYRKEEWEAIVRGPAPFTAGEEEILDTRRRIRWRVLGLDSDGNHIVEVTNGGSRALPVLTVGARSRNGRLNGAVLLKIGHAGPGQTVVLHIGCYKDLVPPEEIELFTLPDPRPEDRGQYVELENT